MMFYCVLFQLVNNMTMAVDVYSKTEDLKRFRAIQHLAGTQEFTKLATINPRDSFCPPLYVAYHCPLYLKPADLELVCLSILSQPLSPVPETFRPRVSVPLPSFSPLSSVPETFRPRVSVPLLFFSPFFLTTVLWT